MSLIKPSRRGLIGGIAALIAAPALVRADSLMKISAPKIKPLKNAVPAAGTIWFDSSNHAMYVYAGDIGWIAAHDGQVATVIPAFETPETLRPARPEDLFPGSGLETGFELVTVPLGPMLHFGPAIPNVALAT